jgi:uncharacterized membrane protein
MRLAFGHARRAKSERGAVLVLTALLLASLLGVSAIVIDLGALRGNVRVNQSVADFAALAAGQGLGTNNSIAACQAAVNSVNSNAKLSSAINASSFCSTMGSTVCSGGSSAKPRSTVFGFDSSVRSA